MFFFFQLFSCQSEIFNLKIKERLEFSGYATISGKSSWEGCNNVIVVNFNVQNRLFSFLLITPRPPYSMLGYKRTITRTNTQVLLNIEPGARETRKTEVKSGSLPNTFDDDCRFELILFFFFLELLFLWLCFQETSLASGQSCVNV